MNNQSWLEMLAGVGIGPGEVIGALALLGALYFYARWSSARARAKRTAAASLVTSAATGDGTTRACPFCAESIQVAAIKCKHCGERVDEAGMQAREGSAFLRMAGMLLALSAGIAFIYFWQIFDPSVATAGGDRVYNLSKAQFQQTWMFGTGATAAVGALFAFAGRKKA